MQNAYQCAGGCDGAHLNESGIVIRNDGISVRKTSFWFK